LAYPSIIPSEYHPQCFYEDFDDLVARLSEAITSIEQTRRFSLRSVAAQYDWQHQSKSYDRLFLEIVGG
jgi:hypothetical protein